MGRTFEEKVLSKVVLLDNGCHAWSGSHHANGHAVYNNIIAYKIIWEIQTGDESPERLYRHCDTVGCVNISHYSEINKYETKTQYHEAQLSRRKVSYLANADSRREDARERASQRRQLNPNLGKESYKKRIEANPRYNEAVKLSEYGLTLSDYDTMFASQDGRCYICGQEETGLIAGKAKKLAVDHNPRGSKQDVRALLCGSCNGGLGLFRDNPVLLSKAISYVEDFTEVFSSRKVAEVG